MDFTLIDRGLQTRVSSPRKASLATAKASTQSDSSSLSFKMCQCTRIINTTYPNTILLHPIQSTSIKSTTIISLHKYTYEDSSHRNARNAMNYAQSQLARDLQMEYSQRVSSSMPVCSLRSGSVGPLTHPPLISRRIISKNIPSRIGSTSAISC